MADLKRAVSTLVDAATSEVDPKALRTKVEAVLAAFDDAPTAARASAAKTLGGALAKAEGRGAQVLALALGALVEEGAAAEAAWPAASKNLAAILEQATAFAHAVVQTSGEEDLEDAMNKSGAAVAKKMPTESAAWKAVPARCLAAVACLARSKAVRLTARKKGELADAAWSLSDAIAEVGALFQCLNVLDDASIIVIEGKKGWKLKVEGVAANAELYLLVAEATGKKIDAKVLASLRAGETPKKKAVTLPFSLGIDPEGDAGDLPITGKDLILIVSKGKTEIDLGHLPVLDGLIPDAKPAGEISAAAVAKLTGAKLTGAKK